MYIDKTVIIRSQGKFFFTMPDMTNNIKDSIWREPNKIIRVFWNRSFFLVFWDHSLYFVYILNCFRSCARGVVGLPSFIYYILYYIFYQWPIKPRLLFIPYRLCFLKAFLFFQIYLHTFRFSNDFNRSVSHCYVRYNKKYVQFLSILILVATITFKNTV